MRKRSLLPLLALCFCSNAVKAQEPELQQVLELGPKQQVQEQRKEQRQELYHHHMDFGVTLGTTGIGFDVATQVTDFLRLRTGMSYMPKIEVPMSFGIQIGDDAAKSQSKFNRLSGLLTNFTGKPVQQEVQMTGRPTFWNWNVMVDLYPLKRNRHWHLTAGFFLGPSKVAEAFNKTESMSSLLAVSMYNNIYDRLHGLTRRELAQVKLIDVEGFDTGNNIDDLILMQQKLDSYGRMGVNLGYYSHDITDDEGNVIHKQGDAYMMDPDDDSMVKADMKVKAFKPYVGIGYDGRLLKNDKRLYIGFDAGVMMWGGTPHLTTHDGTDMIHDLVFIPGKVGDYVHTLKMFKAFPMVNLRLSYWLF